MSCLLLDGCVAVFSSPAAATTQASAVQFQRLLVEDQIGGAAQQQQHSSSSSSDGCCGYRFSARSEGRRAEGDELVVLRHLRRA
ncbi:hypothetical protein Emag_000400 [Eimeria magna]